MKRLNFDDVSLAFEDRGHGMPLLCIHGYPLNRLIWQDQWENLDDIARLIVPDLRGHGDSSGAPGGEAAVAPYGMELFADDCLRLLDHLNVPRALVCGLSMGGYVAFALLRRAPQRVAGLILTATRARPDSPEAKENRLKAVELLRREGVPAIVDSMLPRLLSPATFAAKHGLVQRVKQIMLSSSPASLEADLLGMRDRQDSTALLPGVTAPALILMGKDDVFIPLAEAEEMLRLLPNARLELIPNAAHLPNMEQPELFNQHVRDFIRAL